MSRIDFVHNVPLIYYVLQCIKKGNECQALISKLIIWRIKKPVAPEQVEPTLVKKMYTGTSIKSSCRTTGKSIGIGVEPISIGAFADWS